MPGCLCQVRIKRLFRRALSLQRYIDVDESEVELEDMPIVGIAGSGGGYRAMVRCYPHLPRTLLTRMEGESRRLAQRRSCVRTVRLHIVCGVYQWW